MGFPLDLLDLHPCPLGIHTHIQIERERDTIFKIESTMTLDTSSSSHLPHYPQARVLSHESHKHVVMVIGGQGRVEHKVSTEFKGLGVRKCLVCGECSVVGMVGMCCHWNAANVILMPRGVTGMV